VKDRGKDRRRGIVRQANTVVTDFITRKVREKTSEVVSGEPTDEATLRGKIMDANSWISTGAGGDKDLYDRFRLRLFRRHDGRFHIIQGEELDVDARDWLER
jgi:hypothetical protein